MIKLRKLRRYPLLISRHYINTVLEQNLNPYRNCRILYLETSYVKNIFRFRLTPPDPNHLLFP